jgi:predicted ATP-binding protein involved in virulence
MPLMRLIAEKIGPFETLDIDLSDGPGRPRLGPHILAGVNASGKSTVLRAIAWTLSSSLSGFPEEEWWHFLRGPESRVLVCMLFGPNRSYINAGTADTAADWEERLKTWVASKGVPGEIGLLHSLGVRGDTVSGRTDVLNQEPLIAAYAPVRALSYVDSPAKMESLKHPTDDSLGFESSVQNRAIQRWLVDLFSRRALAKERGQEFDSYEQTLTRFQDALKLVCDDPKIRIDVELGPILEPRLNFHGKNLNFSQLSDGIRTTIGWLADFMMRQDRTEVSKEAKSAKSDDRGILLLDEIDIYLHPRWQRTLLPAIRKALPNVQVVASSHSPFVISSCRDARIHILTLDERGTAHTSPPQDAPFGESITATLKDIFGVESRFDAQTENDLKTWDNLRREEAVGRLTQAKRKQLDNLSRNLSERSEELRLIVNIPRPLPTNVLNSLTRRAGRKPPHARSPKGSGTRTPRSVKLG